VEQEKLDSEEIVAKEKIEKLDSEVHGS